MEFTVSQHQLGLLLFLCHHDYGPNFLILFPWSKNLLIHIFIIIFIFFFFFIYFGVPPFTSLWSPPPQHLFQTYRWESTCPHPANSVCLHLSTHTQHAHAQDTQKLFVSHMRASHASVWFCRAVASVCLRLAAHSPVGFGRISPHLAQEEERASHSEGLHWLTRAYTRTCPHLLACILHIKKSKKSPCFPPHTDSFEVVSLIQTSGYRFPWID